VIETRQSQVSSPILKATGAVGNTSGPPAHVRSLVFALAGTFVLRCASYGAGSIIPIFLGIKNRTDADITAGLAAFVAVTFYAAELIGAPIFGALSDRFGRKFFMVLGPVFGGVAIQLLGFTAIIPVLALVRILEGLSTASSAPATLGFISAQTANSERLRGRVMGFYEAATVVGLASGAAIAGQLYDRYATFAFTLVALIYALALVLFMFVRDRGSARVSATHHRGILKRMFNRRIMRFAPAWLSANAVLGVWLNVAPFLAAGAPDPDQFLMGQYSAGEIGTAFLVFGVLFTAGAITWGFVMPLIGRQATLMWGVSGLACSSLVLYLLNQVAPDRPELVVVLSLLIAVGIFVESGFTPAALAYLAEIAEERPEDRGSVMGVYSVLLSVGQLAGTALAGPFADRWGWPFGDRWGMNGIILLTGLLCLVAAFTLLLLGYAERRERVRQAQIQAGG
jgi:MFS family permease